MDMTVFIIVTKRENRIASIFLLDNLKPLLESIYLNLHVRTCCTEFLMEILKQHYFFNAVLKYSSFGSFSLHLFPLLLDTE